MLKKKTYTQIKEQLNKLPWNNMYIIYTYYEKNFNTPCLEESEFKKTINNLIFKYCSDFVNRVYKGDFKSFIDEVMLLGKFSCDYLTSSSNNLELDLVIREIIYCIKINFDSNLIGVRTITITFFPDSSMQGIICYNEIKNKRKNSLLTLTRKGEINKDKIQKKYFDNNRCKHNKYLKHIYRR